MIKNFFDLSKIALESFLLENGQQKFRTGQIWDWIYTKGAKSFFEMTNLGTSLRELLTANFSLEYAHISRELISLDETRKWLLKFIDNNEIETVFIPEESRSTLCVSSQVGCTLTCKFCHTGTQKLVRNLTAGEIIMQLMHAKDSLYDWPADKEGRSVSNIVMMGMGEPLLNYANVSQAIKIMMDPHGLNISKHKITLSTSGIIPNIYKCAADLGVNLAISLHATTDELRNEIVPINKKYPIRELLKACYQYSELTARKRNTFEYVMLKGVNDSIKDAKRLIKLISGNSCQSEPNSF
ncbi:MAG: 23S rRNA (adenine(2503)-C(2))-methyltransferase RlmN [Candidatus Midichloria sp.]|nr:23S rRNA (adenine(2503)-C(2))-methyltransferase RlmN [Candidatus Midichloria sp.]